MARRRVFLTGATGSMGRAGMDELLRDADEQDLVILARPGVRTGSCWTPTRDAKASRSSGAT